MKYVYGFIVTIYLLFLFWCFPGFGQEVQVAKWNPYVSGTAGAAAACTSGTAEISQVESDDSRSLDLYDLGQSITIAGTINLFSISVWMNGGASIPLHLRIGESADLSSTYIEEIDGTLTCDNTPCLITFTSVAHPELTTGTYYFIVQDAGANASVLYFETIGAYAGGSYYVSDTDNNWNVATNVATRDLYFVVNKCAD
jgi:hypothetical protein